MAHQEKTITTKILGTFLLTFGFLLSFKAPAQVALVAKAAGVRAVPSVQRIQNWATVAENKQLFFDYIQPQANKPTIVFLNGLTATTEDWNGMTEYLVSKGMGVLRFDFYGQGKTLARYGEPKDMIAPENQAEDLRILLEKLNVPKPYNLVGHSYGGGIGQVFISKYPQLVKNLILMAPYTRPVDWQDNWIRTQILMTSYLYPFNSWTYDQNYDYYLKIFVYTMFPVGEPSLNTVKYKKESTFRLTQGIRRVLTEKLAPNYSAGKVHLIVGAMDNLVLPYVLDVFWRKVNPQARMSRVFVQGVGHYINAVAPRFTAAWVSHIASGTSVMFQGHDFLGFPTLGYVETIGGGKFAFEKDESVLSKK